MISALIITALFAITAALLVAVSRRVQTESGGGSRDSATTLAVLTLIGHFPLPAEVAERWRRWGHAWRWVFRGGLSACLIVEALRSPDMTSFWGLLLWMLLLTVLLVRLLPRLLPTPPPHTP